MGAFGSILLPVLVFVVVGRLMGGRLPQSSIAAGGFLRVGLPVFASILIALSGVLFASVAEPAYPQRNW
jgi:hypothetical protein